jgi:hypothetical protein
LNSANRLSVYLIICVRQSAYLLTPVCLSTYASLLVHTHPAIPLIPLSNTVGTSADAVYLLSRGSKPLGVTPILHICLRQTASLVSKLFPVLKLLIPTLKLVHFRASAALTDASHQARFFHHVYDNSEESNAFSQGLTPEPDELLPGIIGGSRPNFLSI